MQKSKKAVSMAEYNSRFAETLRYIMDKHGTTQKELADFVGVRHKHCPCTAPGKHSLTVTSC